MASPGIGSHLVRMLRGQEQNERQAWLNAAGIGLVGGCSYGGAAWLVGHESHAALDGLVFGGVYMIAYGLGRTYRLRRRKEAPEALQHLDH